VGRPSTTHTPRYRTNPRHRVRVLQHGTCHDTTHIKALLVSVDTHRILPRSHRKTRDRGAAHGMGARREESPGGKAHET
jgi:hypothetical protein